MYDGDLTGDGLTLNGRFYGWTEDGRLLATSQQVHDEDAHYLHGGRKASSFFIKNMTQGKSMAIGGALAGGLMYLHCKAKCPGGQGTGKGLIGAAIGTFKQAGSEIWNAGKSVVTGIGGAVGGMMGMGGDDKPYGTYDNGEYKPPVDLVRSIHKRTCACNCKLDAILAAAAGAAAGKMYGMYKGYKMGPLDEWTTAPFYAATLSKDGRDLLDLNFKESRPRDALRDLNHEFFSEFLCLDDACSNPLVLTHDSQFSPSSNQQEEGELEEGRESRGTPEIPARWMNFFQTEPSMRLDESTEDQLA